MKEAALQSASRKELARRRLLDFCQYVDPNYVAAPHIRFLCEAFERLEAGHYKNLIVLVPPRHGKTRLVSQLLPAWWLGRHPRDHLILASNVDDLAADNSAAARNLMLSEEYPFTARVASDTSAKDLWRTTAGGVVRAAGVNSAIQGRGYNLGICDDPIAGVKEATDTAFEKQWRWFVEDFLRRRLTDSHVILSMFRWGDKDLAGKILLHEDEEFRKDWAVISLPAYAREDDALGREPGDVLWEPTTTQDGRRVGFDKAFLESQRRTDSSGRSWQAQYCLEPVDAEGETFLAPWFENFYDALPRQYVARSSELERQAAAAPNWLLERLAPNISAPMAPIVVQSCDSAWKDAVSNDRSVVATLYSDGLNIYVANVWYGRLTYTALLEKVVELYRKYGPRVLYVEEASSGYALIDQMRNMTRLPVVGVKPGRESKQARAESVTQWFESGRVKFPKEAPWMSELLNEFLRFPHGTHDDIVDAVCLGVRMMQNEIARRRNYESMQRQVQQLGGHDFMAR